MPRFVFLSFLVLVGGCFEPDEIAAAGTETGSTGALPGSSSLSPGSSGPMGEGSSGPGSTGSVDDTGSEPTSTTTGEVSETTGACSPGVFGRSDFDNACFQ